MVFLKSVNTDCSPYTYTEVIIQVSVAQVLSIIIIIIFFKSQNIFS